MLMFIFGVIGFVFLTALSVFTFMCAKEGYKVWKKDGFGAVFSYIYITIPLLIFTYGCWCEYANSFFDIRLPFYAFAMKAKAFLGSSDD